jgi:hypothetical protein
LRSARIAKRHRLEAARHEQQRQARTDIRNRHHALTAEWMRVLKELDWHARR